jgi:hypothetical protein
MKKRIFFLLMSKTNIPMNTFLSVCCLAVLFSFPNSWATETDQFLSWKTSLSDSSLLIDDYFNLKMRQELKKSGTQNLSSCFEVAIDLMSPMRLLFIQRIELWADSNPHMEVFPANLVSQKEYYRQSIYSDPNSSPFDLKALRLGRTVMADGVYFGSDKLGHFVSFGARYLNRYLKNRKEGLRRQEALNEVLDWGVYSEVYYVGSKYTGVTSYSDLEANYQGFRFLLSICDMNADSSLKITGNQGSWRLQGQFQISNFVNPHWDESFYHSQFSEKLNSIVKNNLEKMLTEEMLENANRRFEHYRRGLLPSYNVLFLKQRYDIEVP